MKLVKLPMVLEDACPDKDLKTPVTDIWVNPEHVITVEEDWHDRAVLSMDRSDARASITVALPAAEVVALLASPPAGGAVNFAGHRFALGYTQAELADLLGVSQPTIHRWEDGITAPQQCYLDALAALPPRGPRSPPEVSSGRGPRRRPAQRKASE